MKWIFISLIVLLFNACNLFDDEPKVLLSNIDGEEYFAVKEGDMNARKAALFILEGLKDSVSFDAKLDLLDSLETKDIIWKDRYLKSFGLVLKDVYAGENLEHVEDKSFSFLIHKPKDLVEYLNNDGFDEIDTWMLVLSRGLKKAIEPNDITINSVANAVISNCIKCDEDQQKFIVDFILKLERFN